jgi:hypothetical protein
MTTETAGRDVAVRCCCAAAGGASALAADANAVKPRNARAFAHLLALEGEWRGRSSEKEVHLTYEVTGKRSAVVERYRHVFKGELMADEMLTLFHLDGEDLVLTHYCTLGSQPRMRARLDGAAEDEIRFEYVGATNLPHPDSLKMSGLHFKFIDPNRFVQTWHWDGEKRHIRPENRSDDFDDIPDAGDGADTFVMERVR